MLSFKTWIEDKVRNTKYGIANLKYWFYIIWGDRWWDFSFIYLILRHKLKRMEKGFREQGITMNASKDAHNIKICILLLDRLIKNDYYNYNKISNPKYPLAEMDKEGEMIQQDLDLLFKILRKQIESWWD